MPLHNGDLLIYLDEDCQYGFDGEPIKGSAELRKKSDKQIVKQWILSHQTELEKAWEDVNNGINPGMISD